MPYVDKKKKAEANRRWAEKNPEKVKANRAAWLEKQRNKPKKQRVKTGRDVVKKGAADANRRAVYRHMAIEQLGGACVRCGISDARVLEFDHIAPLFRRTSGHKSRSQDAEIKRIAMGGDATGLQLLCCNCHRIKTRDGGEFKMKAGHANAMRTAIDVLQRSLFDEECMHGLG